MDCMCFLMTSLTVFVRNSYQPLGINIAVMEVTTGTLIGKIA